MTITIEQAQAQLGELIDKLAPDEELIVTRNSQPVAKISKSPPTVRQPREAGSAKDKILWI
jgi:prevent-host-death family protein